MKLDEIGIATITEQRAQNTSTTSPMTRGELFLTNRCNYDCAYCNKNKLPDEDLSFSDAVRTIAFWKEANTKTVHFTGGEPALYADLPLLVRLCRVLGMRQISMTTNGSESVKTYIDLIRNGVNNFSVSVHEKSDDSILDLIYILSACVYTTASIAITEKNQSDSPRMLYDVLSTGVHDVYLIPLVKLPKKTAIEMLDYIGEGKHWPILRYRLKYISTGTFPQRCSRHCWLALDESTVIGNQHYPCAVYAREGGKPIGRVTSKMREDRSSWVDTHDLTHEPICRKYCRDFCIEYNNYVENYRRPIFHHSV